jgi:hypothetical protein
MWGGGFQAKRAMAADKFCDAHCVWTDHHPDCKMAADKQEPAQESWREFASDYERGFIDGMQKQAQSSVDKAVNQMAQREWAGLTDEEIQAYWDWEDWQTGAGRSTIFEMVRDIETKLKRKNT